MQIWIIKYLVNYTIINLINILLFKNVVSKCQWLNALIKMDYDYFNN
jgi:hypothetical protein